MTDTNLRTRRDAEVRRAFRHLQLHADAEAQKVRPQAYLDMHKGCASKCLEEARQLTREMHRLLYRPQAFTDSRGNDISHLVAEHYPV